MRHIVGLISLSMFCAFASAAEDLPTNQMEEVTLVPIDNEYVSASLKFYHEDNAIHAILIEAVTEEGTVLPYLLQCRRSRKKCSEVDGDYRYEVFRADDYVSLVTVSKDAKFVSVDLFRMQRTD